MLSFTVLLLLTLTLLFALTTASTPSRLSTRVPSTPSTPTPSTPVPPHRHTNFHLELERQYSLGLRQRPEQTANVTQRSISQPLDHFDRLNTARYNQTYWVNTQYWDGTGPVFLWLGGEWVEDADTLEYGGNVMGVWAKQFGGAMVNTQHRYYDGRNPPSKEGDTTGLQYLSSQQALADVAAIVAHLNAEWAATHGARGLKWIHVGGSYGGNMAAWYRLKYPNLSVGAFAISGPVQAVVDYTGFFGVEGHDLTPSCLNFTRAAVRQLDALVADSGKGWAQVREDFGVNITSELDAATWGFTLGWDLLGGGSICRQNRSTETPYQTLARVWKSEFSHFNATYDPRNVWQGYSWLWYYQTCTEMVRCRTLSERADDTSTAHMHRPSGSAGLIAVVLLVSMPWVSCARMCVCVCGQGYYQVSNGMRALAVEAAIVTPSLCSTPLRSLRLTSPSMLVWYPVICAAPLFRPARTSTATRCRSSPNSSPPPTSLQPASARTASASATCTPTSTGPTRTTAAPTSPPPTHSSATATPTAGARPA